MTAPADDPVGTVRRAPTGFAHAIKCEQGGDPDCWQIIDAYGAMPDETTDDDVKDWPVVYVPESDAIWKTRGETDIDQCNCATKEHNHVLGCKYWPWNR